MALSTTQGRRVTFEYSELDAAQAPRLIGFTEKRNWFVISRTGNGLAPLNDWARLNLLPNAEKPRALNLLRIG